MKTIRLNVDAQIPILGFGTWQLNDTICVDAVKNALLTGYRHIDTADIYGNHLEVAQGIRESGVPRNEIFITTKVFFPDLHGDRVIQKCKHFLSELETDYIDLLLIHWPNKKIPIEETLHAMNSLKNEGKIKAIGVSNFTIQHLEKALATGVKITNNQIELHPSFKQKEMREYCKANNITVTAYSPLGQGVDLQIPLIQELARKYTVSPAQVVLNWIITQNVIAIPK